MNHGRVTYAWFSVTRKKKQYTVREIYIRKYISKYTKISSHNIQTSYGTGGGWVFVGAFETDKGFSIKTQKMKKGEEESQRKTDVRWVRKEGGEV